MTPREERISCAVCGARATDYRGLCEDCLAMIDCCGERRCAACSGE